MFQIIVPAFYGYIIQKYDYQKNVTYKYQYKIFQSCLILEVTEQTGYSKRQQEHHDKKSKIRLPSHKYFISYFHRKRIKKMRKNTSGNGFSQDNLRIKQKHADNAVKPFIPVTQFNKNSSRNNDRRHFERLIPDHPCPHIHKTKK